MKCLLVIAHPSQDSLNATLAGTAAAALREAGHEVKVRDLYGQGFAPALTATEWKGFASGTLPDAVAAEAEELRGAEALILVFPTWWFSMPAILKGWFDRIWAPGLAYEVKPGAVMLTPLLNTLKWTLAITTMGSPWWVDRLVLRRPVKRVLKYAMLKSCAPRSKFEFVTFYGCDSLSPAQVDRLKARVSSAIRRIR